MQKFLLLVFVFIFILLRSLHRLVHNKSTIFSVQGIFTLSSKCKRKSSALPRRSLCLVCWRRMKWKKNAFFSDFLFCARRRKKNEDCARVSQRPNQVEEGSERMKKNLHWFFVFFFSSLHCRFLVFYHLYFQLIELHNQSKRSIPMCATNTKRNIFFPISYSSSGPTRVNKGTKKTLIKIIWKWKKSLSRRCSTTQNN